MPLLVGRDAIREYCGKVTWATILKWYHVLGFPMLLDRRHQPIVDTGQVGNWIAVRIKIRDDMQTAKNDPARPVRFPGMPCQKHPDRPAHGKHWLCLECLQEQGNRVRAARRRKSLCMNCGHYAAGPGHHGGCRDGRLVDRTRHEVQANGLGFCGPALVVGKRFGCVHFSLVRD